MILFDALHINNGGGKVLLDILISELDKNNNNILFLFDSRIRGNHCSIKNNKVKYINSGFFSRLFYYLIFGRKFLFIFSFGNIPPYIKRKNQIAYTYFHQELFLNSNKRVASFSEFLFFFKSKIIYLFRGNTNFWIVQSSLMLNKLSFRFSISEDLIKICPFYRDLSSKNNLSKICDKFIYVSDAASHKNHDFLIETFCSFYDKYKYGSLYLTVSSNFIKTYNLIIDKCNKGYPIHNLGLLDFNQISDHLSTSSYTFYPSLAESFGLGLVESIICGSKLITSDLPYVYQICIPSFTFDPRNEKSLFFAFEKCMVDDLPDSKILIDNKLSKIIELFENEK